MQSSNIAYSYQVAHIRAIAALLIVFYHGEQLIGQRLRTGARFLVTDWRFTADPFLAFVREGHTAVSLFMVLSGFIFVWGAWQRSVDWGGFMTNRLLRIYPLYLTVLLLSICMTPETFDFGRFMCMILPLSDVQKVDSSALLAMSWAIAVEFQFYLLFPFMMNRLNRSPAKVVLALLGIGLLVRTIGVGLGGNARDLSYGHLTGRIDQFALGMGGAALLRVLLERNADRARRTMRILLAVAVPAVFGLIYAFHRNGGYPAVDKWKIVWPTVEGLAWAAVIVAYVGASINFHRWIMKGLANIGELSFSIYLLHFPMITILNRNPKWIPRLLGNPGDDALLATLLVVVPMTLVCSSLTYAAIEKPFLSVRRRYLHAPAAPGGSAS